MKQIIKTVNQLIDDGFNGNNQGLDNGFDRLNNYLYGVQRGIYTVIAGGPGSGKTALLDSMFVYNPYMFIKNKSKLKIIYYSLEINASIKLIKFVSRYIYEKYGKVLDVNYILSKGKNKINSLDYTLVKKAITELEPILDCLIIKDYKVTGDSIYNDLYYFASKRGEFKDNGFGYVEYIPKSIYKDDYVIVIIDHMGLLSVEDKKAVIDKVSGYLVYFRNTCNFIPVMTAQLNREQSSALRRQNNMKKMQLSDIKDTGAPAEDADVVLGLENPYRDGHPDFFGYNVVILKDKLRLISILKNRYGQSEKMIGVNFFGEIGLFRELPPPDKMPSSTDAEGYKPYLTLTP